MVRQRILLPVSDGVGDLASLGGDAVVLPEDSPVSVRHLVQLLLRPVSVVPALLCFLLAHLLQSGSETRLKDAEIVGGEGKGEDAARGHLSFLALFILAHMIVRVSWDLPLTNIGFHSLFLLLLFQCPPLLHEVTVETRLFSLLLLQVDAGDESSSVELNLMLFFVTESHIKYTLMTCSSIFRINAKQSFHTASHRVVVD